ncbi:hypothetical protein D3C84_1240200 [compost metagenome]
MPRLTRQLEHSGESRFAGIDGLREYLAFGVFVYYSIITWIFLQTGVGSVFLQP